MGLRTARRTIKNDEDYVKPHCFTINFTYYGNRHCSTGTVYSKELPYAYDALAPQVSEETLRFHHDKHYVGYVNKLNELILDTPYAQQPLEDIVVSADGAIFNNAAQMWNHEFFFDELSPKAQTRPTGALLKAIDADFGSFEQFKAQMEKAAVGLFGSGWAWLAEDKSGKLAIVTEQNAGNPMCHGMKPLMCFDVLAGKNWWKWQKVLPLFF